MIYPFDEVERLLDAGEDFHWHRVEASEKLTAFAGSCQGWTVTIVAFDVGSERRFEGAIGSLSPFSLIYLRRDYPEARNFAKRLFEAAEKATA